MSTKINGKSFECNERDWTLLKMHVEVKKLGGELLVLIVNTNRQSEFSKNNVIQYVRKVIIVFGLSNT